MEGVDRIWHSKRLLYRGLSQQDQAFIFSSIDEDPVNCCLATPMLLAPPSKKSADEWWTQFKTRPSSLLNVVVCLPPTTTTTTNTTNTTITTVTTITNRDTTTCPPPPEKPAAEPKPIGFLNLEYGGYGASPHSRSATLGITLAKEYQDTGYGTEIVNWALDWGFRYANLHSIHLGSVEYNKRAHRCYQKCGFTMDGRRRQCFWHDRRYWDLYFFSILEDEWDALRHQGKVEDA